MRYFLIPLIAIIFIASCNSQDNSGIPGEVPLPEKKSELEPAVAQLFQQTANRVQESPADSEKWGVHATALFMNGYYELGLTSYDVALQLDPDHAQLRYFRAICLWRLNRQEEAIANVQRVLESVPNYDAGWRQLAVWHLERGDAALAIQYILEGMRLQPDRVGMKYVFASCLMDLDRPEEALALLEESIASGNAPPWLFGLASKCFQELGNAAEAERALEKAGPPMPYWPDPWLSGISKFIVAKASLAENAISTFRYQGPKKAMPLLVRAIRADPENMSVRSALVFSLRKAGRLQEALELLEKASGELDCNYWNQYASVCSAKAELGGGDVWWEKAIECLENSIALSPTDGDVFESLAKICVKLGNEQEALTHWSQAGQLHIDTEHWDKAEIAYAFALQIDGTNAPLAHGLARAQIGKKRFNAARSTITTLLVLDPDDPIALGLLKEIPPEEE